MQAFIRRFWRATHLLLRAGRAEVAATVAGNASVRPTDALEGQAHPAACVVIHPAPSRHRWWHAALLGAVFAACARGPAAVPDAPVTLPAAFSEPGALELDARWWHALNDPSLDATIEQSLEGNLDLRAAAARVDAARAVVQTRRADALPEIAATARAGAEAPPPRNGSRWTASLGLEASWEPDLWGRVQASVAAERLRVDATDADYAAAAVSVSADVATAWARLGAAREQGSLLDRQLQTNRDALALLERRFAQGTVPAVDVLRQRELIEETEDAREDVAARTRLLEHQLSVLLGEAPASRGGEDPQQLPTLRALPATGVPGELLQRRPDVQAAWLRAAAADRDAAAAAASRYPSLRLTASLTTGEPAPERLFRDWAAAVAGELFAPLFQGGRIRAEMARTEAVEQELLFRYAATVLLALQEVEDALVSEAREAERIDRLDARLALARDARDRLEARYRNGVTDYLDVLTATIDVQTLERARIDARLARVEQRIALHRALAGALPDPDPDD